MNAPLDDVDYVCCLPGGSGPLDLAAVFGRRPDRFEVDIGCGKGRFLLSRAAAHPDTAFLGVDRNRGRLEKVARRAKRAGLRNLRLLAAEAAYAVEVLMPRAAVNTVYVFFPDPWPKRRHHRRRLFAPAFLEALDAALAEGGRVHVATDHLDYFNGIRALLAADRRFRECPPFIPEENERTDFEVIFLAKQAPIGRCTFEKKAGGTALL